MKCGGIEMKSVQDEAFGSLFVCKVCQREVIYSFEDPTFPDVVMVDHLPEAERPGRTDE